MNAIRRRLVAGRDALAAEMKKRPVVLEDVPRERWPERRPGGSYPTRALWSQQFLVQVFEESSGFRMSVNRASVDRRGRWDENIAWDDLQRLKHEAGYGDWWAVEIYPPDSHVVNVANMRHLWLLDAPPSYGWKQHG